MDNDSYCDVTERLFAEFERVHPLPTIAVVVRQCRQDLEGSERGGCGVLERLARQRLSALQPSAHRRDRHGPPGDQRTEIGGGVERVSKTMAG